MLDFLFYTFLSQVIFRDASSIILVGFISGTLALVIAFLTHSLITWKGRQISVATVLRFFLATGFGMWVLRPLLLKLFIGLSSLYGWAHTITDQLGVTLSYSFVANTGAFGFMVVLVLIYNYVAYDRFVFRTTLTDKD